MQLEFSWQIFEKYSKYQICSIQTDSETDRREVNLLAPEFYI